MGAKTTVGTGQNHVEALVRVLEVVRLGQVTTKPELRRATGLGRNVVTQRVAELTEAGVLTDDYFQRSTGGRAPRGIRLRAEAGRVLVAELGATSIGVAVSDLAGMLLVQREETADVTDGPQPILSRVADLWDELLSGLPGDGTRIWGIGIGLPGPVEFATGRPIAPPIMPGWDNFDVRSLLGSRFGAPVWVDNDVNIMALGELRAGLAHGESDFIYVKVGTGIGAGLVTKGSLHRGAQGCAGDIGHVNAGESQTVLCRCGKYGCLEALAGGAALARDGTRAAEDGRSAYLASALERDGRVDANTVSEAAAHGDPIGIDLLAQSARLVGLALAGIVNLFNPSVILIGGGVAQSDDAYLAEIRQTILRRSLPLATRSLQVSRSPRSAQSGMRGAAHMVMDALMSTEVLPIWLPQGSPAGRTDILA